VSISDFEIEKYFDGDLTDEQKVAFEEKMQSDALFAREVRDHQQLRKDLKIQGERLSLLDQMEEIHIKEFGGVPYLKSEKELEKERKASSKKAEKQKPAEVIPEEKNADSIPEIKEPHIKPVTTPEAPRNMSGEKVPEIKERKVVSLKMFYTGIGIAASLAILLTMGGVFLNQQNGQTDGSSGYTQLDKEVIEYGHDTNKSSSRVYDRSNPPAVSEKHKRSATAFAVGKDGYFITNSHVVTDSKKLTLKIVGEDNVWSSYTAEVVMNDEFSDLAMVKITDSNFIEMGILPFTFSDDQALIGTEIFTLGYPKNDIVMEPGIISSTSGMAGDTTAYQVAMSLNGGNSGGPIFNEKGEVVAVVKGKSSEKEGTGYVVRSSYLWDLIKKYEAENDVKIKRPKWNQLSKKKRIQMIKHIRQFVFLVEAEK